MHLRTKDKIGNVPCKYFPYHNYRNSLYNLFTPSPLSKKVSTNSVSFYFHLKYMSVYFPLVDLIRAVPLMECSKMCVSWGTCEMRD